MPAGSSSERPASRPGPATAASATNPLRRSMPPDQPERESAAPPTPVDTKRSPKPRNDLLAVRRRQLLDKRRELVLVEPMDGRRRSRELKRMRGASDNVQSLPLDPPAA